MKTVKTISGEIKLIKVYEESLESVRKAEKEKETLESQGYTLVDIRCSPISTEMFYKQ